MQKKNENEMNIGMVWIWDMGYGAWGLGVGFRAYALSILGFVSKVKGLQDIGFKFQELVLGAQGLGSILIHKPQP